MKLRIRADLILDDQHQAKRLFEHINRFARLYVTLNPGRPEEERSHWSLHKCYHDETPAKPCESVEEHTSR